MFKYDSTAPQKTVPVSLDGKTVSLPVGMNVAAALIGAGVTISRISLTSKQPCSPHCLMGVCFECMMEIDGIQRQACLTEVREGMVINRNLSDHEGGHP